MRRASKLLLLSLLVVTGCLPDSCFDCDENGDADCVANNNNSPTSLPTSLPPNVPPLTLQCASLNTQPDSELNWRLTIAGGVSPHTYTMNFGDGTPVETDRWLGGPQPFGFHEYDRPGDYQVAAQVTDAAGSVQACSLSFAATAPDLRLRCTATPREGTVPLTVAFDGTRREGCIGPCTVTWYFGDGDTHEGGHAVHEYLQPGPTAVGTFAAFGELRDGLDRTAQCRVPILVHPGTGDPQMPANGPPAVDTLSASPNSIVAGQSSTITGTTSDPNPGDTVSWQLTFDSAGAGSVSPSSGAGPILATYTSSATSQGNVAIRATVTDNHGLVGPYRIVSVMVNPPANQPPAILSLSATPSLVQPGGSSQIAAVITDPDGDPVTWTLALDPSSTATGTLSATAGSGNASATFMATPSPGNVGMAVIRLTVQDPAGLTATRTVNVNVVLAKS